MKKTILTTMAAMATVLVMAQPKQQSHQGGARQQDITIETYHDKMVANDKSQVIDVRSAAEYAVNHIKGALNIDLADSVKAEQILASLDPQQPVFTYSIREGRSVLLAKKLKDRGFREVYFMPGGIGTWGGAGYPLETTVDPSKATTKEQYDSIVANTPLLFVDISSIHCGSCKRLHPILDELEKEYANVKILRYEMDENLQLVKALKVKALPTLFFYKNGQIVWQKVGLASKEQLKKVFDDNL